MEAEHKKGAAGRFGPGLPSKSDWQMLFLLNGLSKLKPEGRMAIIQNGSSLFTGDAGSGQSEIRRYLIESDWLDAIVQLPNDSFYNTGIATYIWIITKDKPSEHIGKVQLIDASKCYESRRKSIGNKRVDIILFRQAIGQLDVLIPDKVIQRLDHLETSDLDHPIDAVGLPFSQLQFQQFPHILLRVMVSNAPPLFGQAAQLQGAHILLDLVRHEKHPLSAHHRQSVSGHNAAVVLAFSAEAALAGTPSLRSYNSIGGYYPGLSSHSPLPKTRRPHTAPHSHPSRSHPTAAAHPSAPVL